MKRTAVILSLVSIAVLLGTAGCSTLRKSDSAALQGTWKGQEIGGDTPGDSCLIITGKNLEFRGANTNEWYKGTFSLQEGANPKVFLASITDCCAPKYNGKTGYVLYRIEKDTLTFTVNEPGSPAPPASFDASDTRRFVLKKK
jgi:uncharacterized protein (TIGR03067 family)